MLHNSRTLLAVLIALALIAGACSSGNDVVFDNSTLSTSAPSDTPAEAPEPETTETTPETALPSVVPDDGTTATTEPAAPPTTTPPVLETAGDATALPGTLIVNQFPSTITSVGRDLSRLIEIEEEGLLLRQPNWSPSGEFVAWARGDVNNVGSIVVASAVDGSTTEYVVPFIPFYIQWNDDSTAVATLGPVSITGNQLTGLATIDLESGSITAHHASQSFYFDWSPDGARMITHMDSARLEFYDVATRTITPYEAETGTFEAAQWMPDGSAILYVRQGAAQSAGGAGTFLAQTLTIDELVSVDVESNTETVLAQAQGITAFSVSPDGSRVGYTSITDADGGFLAVLDLASGEETTVEIGLLELWQWSPDSQSILMMNFDVSDLTLAFRVWTDGEVTDYSTARPTPVFINRYFAFWGQYDRSHVLWAPDSSGFVFAAVDGEVETIFFQDLAADLPVRVIEGSVATFAPAGG